MATKQCSVDGCNREVQSLGLCGRHYQRQRNHGSPTAPVREHHGFSKTKTYRVWSSIIDRCENPRSTGYRYYGAQGVTMCRRWRESYLNFLADMGERPDGLSIDRIDPRKGYSPENCRWATATQQARNQKRIRKATLYGREMSVPDWADALGLPRKTVKCRISSYGWDIERALSEPVGNRHFVEYKGESLRISEWAKKLGMPDALLRSRFRQGWSPERAFTEPMYLRQGRRKQG